jgi:acyl-coenzyme A thioesterase PaaI-like protein
MTVLPRDSVREGWGGRRSRVITWHDPAPTAALGASMSGLEYLQAMVDGLLPPPPIGQLMRFDFLAIEPGRVVFACELDESSYNPMGVVHGGLVCTLLDSVAGSALHSTLPQAGDTHPSRSRSTT